MDVLCLLILYPLQNVLSILIHVIATNELATEKAKSSQHCVINHIDRKLVLSRRVALTACSSNLDASNLERDIAHENRASNSKCFIHVSRHCDVVLFQFGDWLERVEVKLSELLANQKFLLE